MRKGFVVVVALAAAICQSAIAQSPLVQTIARHAIMQDFETSSFKFQCPAGYIPISYSFTPKFPYDVYEEQDRGLLDRTGSAVSKGSLSGASQIDGGGITVTLFNIEHHEKQWEGLVTCLSMAASTDNTLVFAKGTAQIPKQTSGVANAFCPADSPVALGGFSNADGTFVQEAGSAPLWGSSAS